jgi:thiosulfate/3-mercaptopyruvate sulfurtransferase
MFKIILSTILLSVLSTLSSIGQTLPKTLQLEKNKANWSKSQLMEPSALAALINDQMAAKPLIFNIGVVQDIKGAKNMGAASEKENLQRFKTMLKKLPKNTSLVVYCGCCPFEKCPNIRPAMQALNDGGFKKARLLNLSTNIKTDWINRGYPVE